MLVPASQSGLVPSSHVFLDPDTDTSFPSFHTRSSWRSYKRTARGVSKFLLDWGKQKSSRPLERESNLNHKSRESWPLVGSQTWAKCRQRTP